MDIYILQHDFYDDDSQTYQRYTYGVFSTIDKAKEIANDIIVNHFKVEPEWKEGRSAPCIYADINEDIDSYISISKTKMDEIIEPFSYMFKKEDIP